MIINSIGGLGDIMFCEPIYRHFLNKDGEKPMVLIHDHQMYMQEYIESANFIPASRYQSLVNDHIKTDNYLPLRFANPVYRSLNMFDYSDYENCMPDKYLLAGLEVDLWKTLQLQFNPDKCTELMVGLDITPKSEYILVNEYSRAGKIEINPKTDYQIIKMDLHPDYTLMDWFFVMLFAKENHHISTSTFYMLQAMTGYKGKIFIYPRPDEDGLRGISKLIPDFKYELITEF